MLTTDTPRTDAVLQPYQPTPAFVRPQWVSADFARILERENIQLRADYADKAAWKIRYNDAVTELARLRADYELVVVERDEAKADNAIRAAERDKLRNWHALLIETLGTDDIAVLDALRADYDKLRDGLAGCVASVERSLARRGDRYEVLPINVARIDNALTAAHNLLNTKP